MKDKGRKEKDTEPQEPVAEEVPEPQEQASKVEELTAPQMVPICQLKAGDLFKYGGSVFRVVSVRVAIESEDGNSKGEIGPSIMVEKGG